MTWGLTVAAGLSGLPEPVLLIGQKGKHERMLMVVECLKEDEKICIKKHFDVAEVKY